MSKAKNVVLMYGAPSFAAPYTNTQGGPGKQICGGGARQEAAAAGRERTKPVKKTSVVLRVRAAGKKTRTFIQKNWYREGG